MIKFLRSFQFEQLSFWFGFLAASLFWLLIVRIRPRLDEYRKQLTIRLRTTSQNIRANIGHRHRADTLKHAQGMHLAAALFSLEEIQIAPRLLAPPIIFQPDAEPPADDIISLSIPYMPDWPELASAYNGHTISLDEAVLGGVNIALVGPPGCGKTSALGYLASQLARNKIAFSTPEERIPILVHAANVALQFDETNLLDSISKAVALYSSPLSTTRLPGFIKNSFASGQVFLLIDGLDELPPDELTAVVNYILEILRQYPATQIVVAADANHIGNLPNIGFISIPLAVWGPRQQAQFARKWGDAWTHLIKPEFGDDFDPISPLLLNGWLLNRASTLTPLEFSLQIWAAYAGDVRGPKVSDAIEAYLRRMTVGTPKAMEALERFAAQTLLALNSSFSYDEAENWVREVLPESILNEAADSEEVVDVQPKSITIPRILPDMIKSGVLVARVDDGLAFTHIIFAGYLAGRVLASTDHDPIYSLPDWQLKNLSIEQIASHQDISPYANKLLSQEDDPLYRGAISIGRWLQEIPLDATWRRIILGRLSNFISEEKLALGIRTRILSGLAKTNDPDISALFRHLLKSPKISVRQMAALGSGYQRDTQAIEPLIQLLGDQPTVSRAAALALVSIGTQPALEALATALLQGSEDIRRAAAEAFSNHPQEGHPTLREASMLDDLLVRRAAIYGLRRIRQPWSTQILEEMQIEEAQWVVKNAAVQAIEEINQADPHIPRSLPPITEIPWLLEFANERKVSMSSGESAWKTLILALKEGSDDEKLAALSIIQRYGYADVFPVIFDHLLGTDFELQEAAYQTMWQIAATGAEIHAPMRYGLG